MARISRYLLYLFTYLLIIWSYQNVKVLVKVQGKCTTDHISAAGPWLKYKGHLENIAENTLIGAVNAETQKVNSTLNTLTGQHDTIPAVAKAYKAAGKQWLIVADENYGEGSAREHAAMQPRFLGGVAVVARSFARIHETNLKKQGVLPLTFVDKKDYELVKAASTVETVGLAALAKPVPDLAAPIHLLIDGKTKVPVAHTLSVDQVEWFKHGSALNMIRSQL